MISPLKQIWFLLFGPRLYKIYDDGSPLKVYRPNGFEKWGDQIIQSLNIMWKITIYASPLVAVYLYRKDYIDVKTIPTFVKFSSVLGAIVIASHCMRGYGRVTNVQYIEFIRVLAATTSDPKTANFSSLRRYDFDFKAWPVNFNSQEIGESKGIKYEKSAQRSISSWKHIPLYIIGEMAIRTFALKLIYPGSISILQMSISKALIDGRTKLVETHNGLRYKIHTRDDNDIDCMFIDKRDSPDKGRVLVITSEGNAGFYEFGVMSTPMELNYSVLGWNHPGFGGSTGKPYPLQEHYAIDAVIQFAIHNLGFAPENIVLYGWSIGCYSVAWAAVQYPEIKGIILDATFDDILPLAKSKMPPSWGALVEQIIRVHVDLNIADILKDYKGPLKLIRRTLDEIICIEDGNLSTNRANDLLIKILTNRYVYLFGPVQHRVIRDYLKLNGPDKKMYLLRLKDLPGDFNLNRKVIYLADKYMIDYESTHCTPLPTDLFQIPQASSPLIPHIPIE